MSSPSHTHSLQSSKVSCRPVGQRRRNLQRRVIARDGRQCVWCSRELTNSGATLDHLLPISAGGSNWEGNLVLACKSCNNARKHTEFNTFWVQRALAGESVCDELLRAAQVRLLDPRVHRDVWVKMEAERLTVGSAAWREEMGERADEVLKRHQIKARRREKNRARRARVRAQKAEARAILASNEGPDPVEVFAHAVFCKLSGDNELSTS